MEKGNSVQTKISLKNPESGLDSLVSDVKPLEKVTIEEMIEFNSEIIKNTEKNDIHNLKLIMKNLGTKCVTM